MCSLCPWDKQIGELCSFMVKMMNLEDAGRPHKQDDMTTAEWEILGRIKRLRTKLTREELKNNAGQD